MGPLLPLFRSEADYLRAAQADEPWLSKAEDVCAAHGIGIAAGKAHLATATLYPVAIVPPGHVVKFYSDHANGMKAFRAEIAGLELMGRDPELVVPRLVAAGAAEDGWRYVVMTLLPGSPLRQWVGPLTWDQAAHIAAWVGRFVHRLQAIPLTDADVDTRRYDFEVLVEHRYWRLSGWLSKHRALTPRLLGQLDDWLPPISELLAGPDSVVAIHGDIKSKHVMISDRDGSPEPVGVIDANASGVGHQLWDLGYIWQTICDHDRGLLEVFLLQAALPGRADPDWPRMALTWALLQSWDNARGIPGIEGFDTLDELAQRSFGPVPDVVRG